MLELLFAYFLGAIPALILGRQRPDLTMRLALTESELAHYKHLALRSMAEVSKLKNGDV